MKKLCVLFFLFGSFVSNAQYRLDGKVIDKQNNEPLTGASVFVENSFNASFTDIYGSFRLNRIREEKIKLVVSFIGYETDTIDITLSKNEDLLVYLEPKTFQTDEVLISSTRVSENAPATATNISKEEIEANNLGQDLPFLLQQTPSVVTTSDAGAGIGYTGIRIRGSDASRINVTINGIPLNDAESHGVFWVNMPDLASSTNSIQIQRGIGTSTNGAGAFGATINMETATQNKRGYGEINNSFGSFNSRKHTVKFGSGLIDNQFSFDGRVSKISSDGYIDRATADLQSYFLSGTYYGKNTIVKAIAFGGKEITYQSWYGTPESRITGDRDAMLTHAANEGYDDFQIESLLNSGRTFNLYSYDNQVDNYEQNHYQLHFSREFSDKLLANLSFHYTKGEGYFEEYKRNESLSDYGINPVITGFDTTQNSDIIRRRWLNNDFYGLTYSVLYNPNNKLSFNLGGGINNYEGDHIGEVIWSEFAGNSFPTDNYYFNQSDKLDGNTYLKTTYRFNNKLTFLVDLQYRHINYQTKGIDNDLRTINVDEQFNFFNPKGGINYVLNENHTFYSFFGIGNREPNRADFVDQPLNTPKGQANKAEKMRNLELGWEHRTSKYLLTANLYLMDYDNQLVLTGQLNDVGSPLRQNVESSYRRGVELQGTFAITEKLSLSLKATFSQNKIESFDELTYDYTNGFDVILENKTETDIALSPNVIVNNELSYKPNKNLELAILSRYIGEQFLDNTSNENRKLDAFFVNDLRVQYKIPTKLLREVKLQLLVNNVFSEEYSSNGYTYSYIVGSMVTENFYYPQALRNYMIGLNLKF